MPTVYQEETFFELFYDLIIVVVLMKLSYLKNDFTWTGFFTDVALFSNFWSCWSMLNVYVTMAYQEDGLHRAYFVLHITAACVMCIFVEVNDRKMRKNMFYELLMIF
jgi:low temperature requirement protein LtrA